MSSAVGSPSGYRKVSAGDGLSSGYRIVAAGEGGVGDVAGLLLIGVVGLVVVGCCVAAVCDVASAGLVDEADEDAAGALGVVGAASVGFEIGSMGEVEEGLGDVVVTGFSMLWICVCEGGAGSDGGTRAGDAFDIVALEGAGIGAFGGVVVCSPLLVGGSDEDRGVRLGVLGSRAPSAMRGGDQC